MADSAIVVDGVSKRFRLYHERNQSIKAALMRGGRAKYEEFWALQDVSFEVPRGSTFGLIGENGSGKSTLLKCIAQILRPNAGSIVVNGSMAALLELGSGFHPELSGRENVYLNGSILGMRKSEIEQRFDSIVDFAGIRQFIDQPVKNYSSGMYVRLGFSIAINVDPEILLVDEVLAVGDANFQDKCFEKFAEFRRANKTVVIVSHAMGSLRTMCDEAAWLKAGSLLGTGPANEIVDEYVDTSHAEHETTDSGASRYGSGEARVTGVQFLDPEGSELETIRTGDAVTLRLHYRADEVVDRPVFGFTVEGMSGELVWAHNTFDGGYVPNRISGTGWIDLAIPKLMLQPGTFDLLCGIVDHTMTHTYDFLRPCTRFEVHQGSVRESGGYIALGGSWRNLIEDGVAVSAGVEEHKR